MPTLRLEQPAGTVLGRRVASFVLLWLILYPLACSKATTRETLVEPRPLPTRAPLSPPGVDSRGREAGSEAIVLIRENQRRCRHVAEATTLIRDGNEANSPSHAPSSPRYRLGFATQEDLAVIGKIDVLIGRSLKRLEEQDRSDLPRLIHALLEAQQETCRLAWRTGAASLEQYRQDLAPSIYQFGQAEGQLARRFEVSEGERQLVLADLDAALRQANLGGSLPDPGAAFWTSARRAEYEEKKRRYEEYERQREEKERAHAEERQRALAEWRNHPREPCELPRVGWTAHPAAANPPPRRLTERPLQSAMEGWYRTSEPKALAAGLAISSTLGS